MDNERKLLDKRLWKKAVKLKQAHEERGDRLSRHKIASHLGISEYDARYLDQLLRDLSVITTTDAPIATQVHLTNRLKASNSELKDAKGEIARLAKLVEMSTSLEGVKLSPPSWTLPQSSRTNRAVAMAMLSDTHFDEVVRPEEISYLNEYNRTIGDKRLKKFGDSLVKLGRDYFSSKISVGGLVLALAGDIISGWIHEELEETNEYYIFETIIHYAEQIAGLLLMLADYYKRIHCVGVVGNHGRLKKKIQFKGAVVNNFDYWLYYLVALHLKGDRRITFTIPKSLEVMFPVYDTMFLLTHGNQFRGGSGWAGPLMPIMRGDQKKRKRAMKVKRPYDWLLTAHFHSLQFLSTAIMNGSLIGVSDYSINNDFDYEPPKQAWWICDPDHGVTLRTDIHCRCDDEEYPILGHKDQFDFKGDYDDTNMGSES